MLVESFPGAGTMWQNLKQSKFVPFNPTDKYTIGFLGTVDKGDGSTYQLMKGAPQVNGPSLSATASCNVTWSAVALSASGFCLMQTLAGLRFCHA